MANRGELIAERALLFSEASGSDLNELKVQIFSPTFADLTGLNAKLDQGAAICVVRFLGIAEPDVEIHGIDGVHALSQAADVDSLLKVVAKKNGYQLFWTSGEPYFED
ncbi:hypothetical protein [Xanthomonas rydalmerensis]|uniref:Uncharacterized protein n=2 Tax=Xanthomonas rydalmerensis TaxID=3046274 RepID=A0ABZ0JN95_9XANT|nr:hypothetical protein [Xanthomonas sp. DM-2023]WOS41135.1 hypothetical protein QN243_01220 [Xanthomonas sp. DM-2023]WOS57862.1 hypothetical protein QN245_01220 [Xanthomonas sp. DM-2023]